MNKQLFYAICFPQKHLPGTPLKYRKISNQKLFTEWIRKHKPNIWYINWYDRNTQTYTGRTYLQ